MTTTAPEPGRTAYEGPDLREAVVDLIRRGRRANRYTPLIADDVISQHIDPLRAENESLRAKLAQAEGEIATFKQQLGEQYMLRAKAGNAIMRLRMAFLVLTESGHGGAIQAVRKWFSDGAEGPVPFYSGALFEAWAAEHGISNVNGFMGYRMTIKLADPAERRAE